MRATSMPLSIIFSMTFCVLLAGPMLATIFKGGAFSAEDVRMASLSLTAYGGGLVALTLVKVLAPGYFARQDTRTPVKVGLIALSFNMVFNVAVVAPAYLAGFPVPHALLALSTGLSAWLNSALLYRGLRRAGVYAPTHRWARLLPQVAAANLAMAEGVEWFVGGKSSGRHRIGLARRILAGRAGLVVCRGDVHLAHPSRSVRRASSAVSVGSPTRILLSMVSCNKMVSCET